MTTGPGRLLVTACGVHSAWSDNAVALAAALECGHGAIRLSDEVPSAGDASRTWMAPIERWQGLGLDYSERLLAMAGRAVDHVRRLFPEQLERIDECHLVLPAVTTTRGEFLDNHLLQAGLAEYLGQEVIIHVSRDAEGLYGCLSRLSNETIENGSAKLLLVADSLVNAPTLFELSHQHLLQTEQDADGVCPGEAAVALVVEQDHGQSGELISIEAVSEVMGDDASSLADISRTLEHAGWSPDDVDALFVCSGQTLHEQLAWYETREGLWQHEISEQERVAMMLGEMESLSLQQPLVSEYFPHLVAGDTGIAAPALALSMIIGQVTVERQLSRFGHEPGRRLMVCGGEDSKGSLCVVPGMADLPLPARQPVIQPKLQAGQPGIH